ncbi:MAG: hypothetical protein WCW53_05895, partial [Syntrophales bacterium]
MTKRILLINPWIYDFSAYDFWMKPMGLLYMASYLRKNGLDVQFIDCLDSGALDFISPGEVKKPARKLGGEGKFIKEKVAKPEALAGISKPYHRYGLPQHTLNRIFKGVEKPDLILITSMMTYWYPGVFDLISIVKDIFP